MKSILNKNTLKALIRDESMASKEYYALSKQKDTPMGMRRHLVQMSQDEARHRQILMMFKKRCKK